MTNTNLTLFHGTSYTNGLAILEDGFIKKNQEKYDILTTSDFVYLTERITSAANYGWKKSILLHKEFFIFQVDIKETNLLVDFDEIAIYSNGFKDQKAAIEALKGNYTLKNTLPVIHSTRVDYDIDLVAHCAKYAIVSIDAINPTIKEDIKRPYLTNKDLLEFTHSLEWEDYIV